jgi:hypothetical protein
VTDDDLPQPWSGFARECPELAGRVRERFEATKHKTMATLRRDGSPRISGTETAFTDTDLTLGSMPGAVKLADLLRDPRIALHSATADPVDGQEAAWPGEAKVAGRVEAVPPVGDGPDGAYFRVLLSEAVLTTITPDGTGLCIESWHPSAGYRKRLRS